MHCEGRSDGLVYRPLLSSEHGSDQDTSSARRFATGDGGGDWRQCILGASTGTDRHTVGGTAETAQLTPHRRAGERDGALTWAVTWAVTRMTLPRGQSSSRFRFRPASVGSEVGVENWILGITAAGEPAGGGGGDTARYNTARYL